MTMPKITLSILLMVLLSVAASTSVAEPSAAEKRLAKLKEQFIETGETQNCINTRHIRQLKIIDKQHILFRLSHNNYMVNKLPRACHGLRRGVTIAYSPVSMQLCSVDTVAVLDDFFSRRGLFGPRCGLGQFTQLKMRDNDPSTPLPAPDRNNAEQLSERQTNTKNQAES